MSEPRIVMVAAVADNGVIGRDADIPWHLPEDMKHFREVTRGHTVVMGRVTYEGIGHPLPFRTNVVVTRQPGWSAEGVLVADSLERALETGRRVHAETGADIVIGGGTQVYEAAMPFATHQVLTEVHQSPEGDTHYPRSTRTSGSRPGARTTTPSAGCGSSAADAATGQGRAP
ncbi:dihydrofolate reductase [Nocardioides mesophilus]|uniref:dihydrofolate reductase n=1 Tax=Nocardioides mesophilus TaxID=433659 RepID=UPI001FE42796|nr:dihydrofolate reductase [Nocardioides mesophilus]